MLVLNHLTVAQKLTTRESVTFLCFVCADLPLNGSFFQVVDVELIVDVAQQIRLDEHLADDTKQSDEANRRAN